MYLIDTSHHIFIFLSIENTEVLIHLTNCNYTVSTMVTALLSILRTYSKHLSTVLWVFFFFFFCILCKTVAMHCSSISALFNLVQPPNLIILSQMAGFSYDWITFHCIFIHLSFFLINWSIDKLFTSFGYISKNGISRSYLVPFLIFWSPCCFPSSPHHCTFPQPVYKNILSLHPQQYYFLW